MGVGQPVTLVGGKPGNEGTGEDDHFRGEPMIACRSLEIRPIVAELILRLLPQFLNRESEPAIGLRAARQASGDKSEAGNIGEIVVTAALGMEFEMRGDVSA